MIIHASDQLDLMVNYIRAKDEEEAEKEPCEKEIEAVVGEKWSA